LLLLQVRVTKTYQLGAMTLDHSMIESIQQTTR